MKWVCAAALAALFHVAGFSAALGQDVTLISRDGAVEISGTLLGFDGEFYRLDTIYGELTVDGTGVRCDGAGCPNLQDFVADVSISGSATMGNALLPALLEAFAKRNGLVAERLAEDATHFRYVLTDATTGKRTAVFRFRVSTSDEGFADLLANEADMVMSLREVSVLEQSRAIEAGLGDLTRRNRARVIALDGIVPVVSAHNPLREISPADLVRVFAGEVTNWVDMGGPDAAITLHALSATTALGQVTAARLADDPTGVAFSSGVIRHASGLSLSQAVARDPFAMGLASYAALGQTRALALKGPCGRVLRATRRGIKTEDYPLTAPLFLYTPVRRLPKIAREFLAFVRGAEAQKVIRRAGFVDQALEEIMLGAQGDRIANAIAAAGPEVSLSELQRMVDRLKPMKRLTLSFRFEAGSTRLDAQSRSNVASLARQFEQGRFDARKVFFVGFSDGAGPAARNQQIALDRAEAVRDAVRYAAETADLSQIDLQVDAFGEAMPLACDDSAWGRQANRRVEVWVR